MLSSASWVGEPSTAPPSRSALLSAAPAGSATGDAMSGILDACCLPSWRFRCAISPRRPEMRLSYSLMW